MRPSGRAADQLRAIALEIDVNKHAEGSCLSRFGDTQVLCTASIETTVPPFLRNSGRGWITAEYGMLPRATTTRGDREAARGRQTGRTMEIQRLIGRSLRAITNLAGFGRTRVESWRGSRSRSGPPPRSCWPTCPPVASHHSSPTGSPRAGVRESTAPS